jgi:DHA1 family multidrug resistance protein-like MFS transporter
MLTSHRKNIYILSFSLIVVMLGFGMVMPIFPFLLKQFGTSGDEYGLLIALYAVMQLIFSPVWGSISDQVGRKPVMLIGMAGVTLTLVMFGFADRLWMIFAARILSGLLASAMMPTAMAYVGDCTNEEERGDAIGKLGGAMALGVILGPGIGGWLAGDSLTLPFFIAAGLSLISLVLIAVILPESLPPQVRQAASQKIKFADLAELWHALFGPIGILLLMALIVSFGATNFQAIFGLYALEKFDFNIQQVGTILVVVGIVSAIIQGLLTGPFTKRFGEPFMIKLTLLTNSLGFLVLMLANSYSTVLLTTGIYVLSHALLRPSVQALTSRRAAGGQGTAMGMNASFMSLGQIAGPIWAGVVFDVNMNYPYLSGAVILFLGFLVSLFWVKEEPKASKQPSQMGWGNPGNTTDEGVKPL